MIHRSVHARWRDLEFTADLPDVQEIIRQEIRCGTIRVRPKRGGGIRILPVGIPEKEEPIEVELSLCVAKLIDVKSAVPEQLR